MLKSMLLVVSGSIVFVGSAGGSSGTVAWAEGTAGTSPVQTMQLSEKTGAGAPLLVAPALSPDAEIALAATMTICANAHVQNIGWQGWVCASNGAFATVGTTGQSLRMEALAVVTSGTAGICAQAHVQDIGWQSAVCGADGAVVIVGTTGQSRRMEALVIGTPLASTCADAHLQDIGWQGTVCAGPGGTVQVGTTGQSRRMEAVSLAVF